MKYKDQLRGAHRTLTEHIGSVLCFDELLRRPGSLAAVQETEEDTVGVSPQDRNSELDTVGVSAPEDQALNVSTQPGILNNVSSSPGTAVSSSSSTDRRLQQRLQAVLRTRTAAPLQQRREQMRMQSEFHRRAARRM